jgi:2-dehydro-3-deoxygluconokinase
MIKQGRFIAVGECMLELSHAASNDQIWRLHSGGDTYNCLIYLARLGFNVGYMTAIGKDPMSDRMRQEWAQEGLPLDLVLTHPTRTPGLYAIHLDANNERSFSYWRSESAARHMLECPGAADALKTAASAAILYVTGITLSILDENGRRTLTDIARQVRANGGDVAFDLNFRARGWPDHRSARTAIDNFAQHVSIAMPSIEDQQAVYNDQNAEDAVRRWRSMGAKEIVVKESLNGATLGYEGALERVAPERTVVPRDTTGAGDAFNAAYLGARMAGRSPTESAIAGNRLAGAVVQHPGAVISKIMMPIGLPKGPEYGQ